MPHVKRKSVVGTANAKVAGGEVEELPVPAGGGSKEHPGPFSVWASIAYFGLGIVLVFGYLATYALYTRFGYRYCRSCEIADRFMAMNSPMLPSNSLMDVPRSNTIFLTIVSRPFCLSALNWAVSAEKVGVMKNTTALVVNLGPDGSVCEAVRALGTAAICIDYSPDKEAGDGEEYGYFNTKNIKKAVSVLDAEMFATTTVFGEKTFSDIMTIRSGIVMELLMRGHNILFSDADVALLKNPVEFIENMSVEMNLDFVGQKDFTRTGTFIEPMSSGFMYIRSNPKTLAFWRSVMSFVLQHVSRDDSKGVNICARDPVLGLNFGLLDPKHFVDKDVHAEKATELKKDAKVPRLDDKDQTKDLYVIHTNWLKGEKKIEFMKKNGYWMLTPEQTALCPASN